MAWEEYFRLGDRPNNTLYRKTARLEFRVQLNPLNYRDGESVNIGGK